MTENQKEIVIVLTEVANKLIDENQIEIVKVLLSAKCDFLKENYITASTDLFEVRSKLFTEPKLVSFYNDITDIATKINDIGTGYVEPSYDGVIVCPLH